MAAQDAPGEAARAALWREQAKRRAAFLRTQRAGLRADPAARARTMAGWAAKRTWMRDRRQFGEGPPIREERNVP